MMPLVVAYLRYRLSKTKLYGIPATRVIAGAVLVAIGLGIGLGVGLGTGARSYFDEGTCAVIEVHSGCKRALFQLPIPAQAYVDGAKVSPPLDTELCSNPDTAHLPSRHCWYRPQLTRSTLDRDSPCSYGVSGRYSIPSHPLFVQEEVPSLDPHQLSAQALSLVVGGGFGCLLVSIGLCICTQCCRPCRGGWRRSDDQPAVQEPPSSVARFVDPSWDASPGGATSAAHSRKLGKLNPARASTLERHGVEMGPSSGTQPNMWKDTGPHYGAQDIQGPVGEAAAPALRPPPGKKDDLAPASVYRHRSGRGVRGWAAVQHVSG